MIPHSGNATLNSFFLPGCFDGRSTEDLCTHFTYPSTCHWVWGCRCYQRSFALNWVQWDEVWNSALGTRTSMCKNITWGWTRSVKGTSGLHTSSVIREQGTGFNSGMAACGTGLLFWEWWEPWKVWNRREWSDCGLNRLSLAAQWKKDSGVRKEHCWWWLD